MPVATPRDRVSRFAILRPHRALFKARLLEATRRCSESANVRARARMRANGRNSRNARGRRRAGRRRRRVDDRQRCRERPAADVGGAAERLARADAGGVLRESLTRSDREEITRARRTGGAFTIRDDLDLPEYRAA
jgi:hypothetical protein